MTIDSLSSAPSAVAASLSSSVFTASKSYISELLNQDIARLLHHAVLPSPIAEACDYAMSGSGKRVRPLLVASAFMTVQRGKAESSNNTSAARENAGQNSAGLNDACRRAMLAVELLHAYSLIHDDLPCMDDDKLRRGRPTCHIAFDEATALLAGDVLQTLAFEVLSADIEGFAPIDDALAMRLTQTFAPRARRMVAGQMLDMNAEHAPVEQAALEAIHRDKTGALIEAATLMGGFCARANAQQLAALQTFAANIGLAFQVQDDILDVTATTDALGKTAGSDERLNKSTYVKLMGVASASEYAKSLFDSGKHAIEHAFGLDNELIQLADWLWSRQK